MPGERVTIRKFREVLRLKFYGNLSNRQICKSCSLGKSTVAGYLVRFRRSSLSWPLKDNMDDGGLERLLFLKSEAQIFIAVRGASSYTYAEATWTQSLPDWIGSHIRAFAYFGGVSKVLVPDNKKSGVNKACFYEPDINLTYLEMSRY